MAPLTRVFQLFCSLLLSRTPLGGEGSCSSQKPLSTPHTPTPSGQYEKEQLVGYMGCHQGARAGEIAWKGWVGRNLEIF